MKYEIPLMLQVNEVSWNQVAGWTGQGGSLLGTKRLVTFNAINAFSHNHSSFIFETERLHPPEPSQAPAWRN